MCLDLVRTCVSGLIVAGVFGSTKSKVGMQMGKEVELNFDFSLICRDLRRVHVDQNSDTGTLRKIRKKTLQKH